MSTPGFTAQTSLYRTSASYFASISNSSQLTGRAAIDHVYKFTFGGDSAYLTNPGRSFFSRCGALGESCCRAPIQNLAADGPLVSCNEGLGCDITTGKCVSACGGPGQVCCDGPETRAPKWTANGEVYSPNFWNMREMCDKGACDRQKHRCFACGTQDGAPCCPPDAAQATARCFGASLHCEFDDSIFATSGICIACGIKDRLPCDGVCNPGLGIVKGLCEPCGAEFQVPCDIGGCKDGLDVFQNLCRFCGNLGQIPCDKGCHGVLGVKNKLCAPCGEEYQPSCDTGCNNPSLAPVNGICKPCGYNLQVPCANNKCVYPYKAVDGYCRVCGDLGELPCNGVCNSPLVVRNGMCGPLQPPPDDSCAKVGEACVADKLQGAHCCQHPGAPMVCNYNKCTPCYQHGEECPLDTKPCCSAEYGDICVLDQFSGKAVCGIPDKDKPDK